MITLDMWGEREGERREECYSPLYFKVDFTNVRVCGEKRKKGEKREVTII